MAIARDFPSQLRGAETRLTRFLARYSIDLLRISLGIVFLAFGVLKFFPGLSPAEGIAVRTIESITLGLVPDGIASASVAGLEVAIGTLLLTGRWLRLGLVLLAIALVGILSPILLMWDEMFRGAIYAPTIEGQYVFKDIVLVAAAAVVAAQALGARMTTDRLEPVRARR
ncbi:MAG: DoxX family membrane protein [Candidatus Limnocylindria bacterium]